MLERAMSDVTSSPHVYSDVALQFLHHVVKPLALNRFFSKPDIVATKLKEQRRWR
jgi:hypothetical protein